MLMQKIKICGIKTQEALDACIQTQVGFVGFNFVPQSPRFITPSSAKIFRQQLPDTIKAVALVVDPLDSELEEIRSLMSPDYLQLHGQESLDRVQEIQQNFNIPLIKAIGIADKSDIWHAESYFNYVDILLLDTKPIANASLTGGTGKQFDWQLCTELSTRPKPIMLAGGLYKENLNIARQITNADFYDICSGVESSRGIKSVELIKALALI